MRRPSVLVVAIATIVLAGCGSSSKSSSSTSSSTPSSTATTSNAAFIAPLTTVTKVVSTVPTNGDVNPYGIVQIPTTVGKLVAGNLLVSNFNDKANNQGTGTTIVQITPAGQVSLFSHIQASTLPGICPGGVGLTTALSILGC
jgi:ABC-type Fe3+-hydroxamate transport system substrate-binding protein